MCSRSLLSDLNVFFLSAISDPLYHHCQLDNVLEMLPRHTAQSLGTSLRDWRSTFLRPLTRWNLSFEDIKYSILANGACDTNRAPWSRNDRCFEHSKEEGGTCVHPPLVCFLKSHICVIRMTTTA